MILRQWGGSSLSGPPHWAAATSKNTACAGSTLDVGAEGFQTLFSGLEGEVQELKPTGGTEDFIAEGPCGRGAPPACLPIPSPPPSLAGSGASHPWARVGGLRRARRPRGPGGRWAQRAGSAAGGGARGEDPAGRGSRGGRERAPLVCERGRAPPARRASPQVCSPPPAPGGRGGSSSLPSPECRGGGGRR